MGLMCDMRELRKIADRFGLAIIEDCAHCVEGARDGVRPGELSDSACFSFYATKNLTCGEGGAIATDRDDLIEKLRLLRLHGMTKTAADRHREGYQHWDVTMLGWKYNMDNIQAAILMPQLRRLEAKLLEREKLACRYTEILSRIPGVTIPASRPDAVHARHLFPICVEAAERDRLIAELTNRQIGTVVNYRAIHLLKYFQRDARIPRRRFPDRRKDWRGDHLASLLSNDAFEFLDIVGKRLRAFFTRDPAVRIRA